MDWNVKQFCVVTNDIERTMQRYLTVLGIGPWDIRHFSQKNLRDFHLFGKLVEEPFEFITAAAENGGLEYELVMPVSGPSIYWKHLKEYGESFHHIKVCIETEEIPEVLKYFEKRGAGVLQYGWLGEDVHYYLDTKALLGFVLEIGNCRGILPPDECYPRG